MQFINFHDVLNNTWSVEKVLEITSKIDDYCQRHGIRNAELCTVEDNTWQDTANMRYDIQIRYVDDKSGHLVNQKLLMLKGEVLDGKTFHKNFKKYYPGKTA